jgi:hypothetical protein
MEQTFQTRSCGLLQLGGVKIWEFWWIDEEPGSQQYIVWQIGKPLVGVLVDFHGELLWHI